VLIVHFSDGGTTPPKIVVARIESQCTDPFTGDQGCTFGNCFENLFVALQIAFDANSRRVTCREQVGEKQAIN